MAHLLKGYRIPILNTRGEAHFSRLLAQQRADVLQCPILAIREALEPAQWRSGSAAA